MSDTYSLQASFSVPHSGSDYSKADMVNVRGNNPEEFHRNLLAFDEHMAQAVANIGTNLRAVYEATRGLGAQTVSTQHHQPQHQGQQQSPPNWATGGQPQGSQQSQGGYGQQNPNNYGNGSQNGYQSPYGSSQQQPNNGIPTEPPPHVGPAPQCSHGTKRFLAKPYKNGKPGYWMGWACPAQQGDPSQHDLEFIRNS